jgi:circadian clock protein KaiC
MAPARKVEIKKIRSGVPGLDIVLGGGIPEYSVNMIVGAPGVGKTTLTHQILFHNVSANHRGLYFVALGEPTLKMLRYQQQFDFFDAGKIDERINYEEIGTLAREQGLAKVLERITSRVQEIAPSFVVIDSFRGLKEIGEARGENVRSFVHDLSTVFGTWQVTTFLLGEYVYSETLSSPEFSAADGIIWLAREAAGNAIIRKLEVVKMRGQGVLSGRHTFRITSAGIEIFPRMIPIAEWPDMPLQRDRIKFGVPGLDEMMSGGIPRGEVALIAGSSGTGKTLLTLHLVAEGVKSGEPSVMVTFEEHPREHERKAAAFGWDLPRWQEQGLLEMIYLRPIDLSVDEVLMRVHETVDRIKAKRVIINSISGFQMGISSSEESEFRESLYRLVASLSGEGVTTVMTTEIPSMVGEFLVSPEHVSFLADNVIVLRYAEISSRLRRVLMVVKMRASRHETELREYRIGDNGIVVEQPFTQFSGVLTGIPTLRATLGPQPFTVGLAGDEDTLMHILLSAGPATAEEIANSAGLDVNQVRQILDRLVNIGYVTRTGPKTDPKYRVTFITPGVARNR